MNYLTPTQFLAANPGKIGRNLLYNEINAGVIPHIKVGRRILIPEDAWDQMLANAASVAQPPSEPNIYLHGAVGSRDFDSAC